MKFKLLPLVLLVLCVTACKKPPGSVSSGGNNTDITFPREMYVSGPIQNAAIRVFTTNGEITDASIKGKFSSLSPVYPNFNPTVGSTALTFLSRDTAMFSPFVSKYSIVINNNDLFLFTSLGSKVIFLQSPNDFYYAVLKYPFPYTPGQGNYWGHDIRVAHGDYNNLYLSILTFKMASSVYPSYLQRTGTVLNEVNDNVISKLGNNDTLITQQSVLPLKAR